jgi:hypothetical protein
MFLEVCGKISNITAKLAYEDKRIKNISSSTNSSVWILNNQDTKNSSKKLKNSSKK